MQLVTYAHDLKTMYFINDALTLVILIENDVEYS